MKVEQFDIYVDNKYYRTVATNQQLKTLKRIAKQLPDAKRIELFVRQYRKASTMFIQRDKR